VLACPACKTSNAAGSKFCLRCNNVLPLPLPESSTSNLVQSQSALGPNAVSVQDAEAEKKRMEEEALVDKCVCCVWISSCVGFLLCYN
jgi:hypothetical protein